MAEETVLEQAMALLPGRGAKKKRASATAMRNRQLGAIQKKLAAVAKNVEKLAYQIEAEGKKRAGNRGSKKPTARKSPARTPPTKKPPKRSVKSLQ